MAGFQLSIYGRFWVSTEAIRRQFPQLTSTNFFITSPEDQAYNCIAWAAEDTGRKWWPTPPAPFAYWPSGTPRKIDIESFVSAFGSLGYQECEDGHREVGWQKVALFANAASMPTHAARQLGNGRWTSKLGDFEDIDHTIHGLEGGFYGNVVRYLKRKI